jgi:hypothetical protein
MSNFKLETPFGGRGLGGYIFIAGMMEIQQDYPGGAV